MNLGKCVAYIEALSNLPIPPEAQQSLRLVAFQRGAQATTRIEGNTLTDDEFQQILDGKQLPKSREYQAKEVTNALNAMNAIWDSVVGQSKLELITPKLLCRWNKMIGEELGPLYDGVPGRLRNDRRHVGRYLAPPPELIEDLLKQFCEWLKREFRFSDGEQPTDQAIVQAVVAHVFFEWIHPFADGNGRTGRLLEFYTLLRAGLPDVTVHVLANHYNKSRPEYASHFDNARKKRDLTEFLDYAIQGLCDGLQATLNVVQAESCAIAWESHVYRVFGGYSDYSKKSVFKRRRNLALAMPVGKDFSAIELVRGSDSLTKEYMGHDQRMLRNDVKLLMKLKLMVEADRDETRKQAAEEKLYKANIGPMLAKHLAGRAMRDC
ncbi:Fic family protein [Rhodopirellula europaea]|uniref:Fic family protein n=1 Tax=Rhodopirellula europaea TaxID=1263866 RepID=UPI003D2BFBF9|tara:strand:+ start:7251 stop:8387 length:1137 start_codon:yes stop_codon:yes gene_type:complete